MIKTPPLRLVLLEASKTHDQHSTFVDGILRAEMLREQGPVPPILYAHETMFERLSDAVRHSVEFRPVPVLDPRKRRLIRKSLLEAWVAFRAMKNLRVNEVLLVSTLLPTAGLILELLKWFFPRRRVVVIVHGEIEGVVQNERLRLSSYGSYVTMWFWLRRKLGTRLELAVIDDFIAEAVADHFPESVGAHPLYVVPILIEQSLVKRIDRDARSPGFRAGFVGFDTPNKGYKKFEALAQSVESVEFFHIGGGRELNLGNGSERQLSDTDEFVQAVAACDVSIFPYIGGYSMAMSAAATDALAAGNHLLTSDRPCFRALQGAFGPESVTVCATFDQMEGYLQDPDWRRRIATSSVDRISRLEGSRFGLRAAANALNRLLQGKHLPIRIVDQ